MNRSYKILGVIALGLLPLTLQAQSAYQSFRLLSPYDPVGSARSTSLSGAMGAIGTEVSSLVRNPAGISLFRGTNRISLTLSTSGLENQANWYNTTSSASERKPIRFDEFAFQMGTNGLSSNKLSFAFAIRNAARYDRSLSSSFSLSEQQGISTLADYAAARTNNSRYDLGPSSEHDRLFTSNSLESPKIIENSSIPFMTILGTGADWIAQQSGERRFASTLPSNDLRAGSLILREQGSITDYDLALGIEVNEAFRLGIVGTLSSLDYNLTSHYLEEYGSRNYLRLRGERSITGLGGKVGMGVLYEPINGLRLGGSIYTPTFYSIKESSTAISSGLNNQLSTPSRVNLDLAKEERYRLRGMWKFGLSGAYIFGHKGFFSVDYDYTTIDNLRMSDIPYTDYWGEVHSNDEGFTEDNDGIKRFYKGVHTIRIGTEILLSPRIALRGGYRYSSSPIKSDLLKGKRPETEVLVPGTTPHYSLPNTLHSYSAGLGWRISRSLSLDVAYVYTYLSGRTFAFPYINDYGSRLSPQSNTEAIVTEKVEESNGKMVPILPIAQDGLEAIKESNKRHQAIATLTYRF